MSEPAIPACREFDTRAAASEALADAVGQVLAGAVERRGSASIVVSGGTSPVTLFHRLQDLELPWSRIVVVPSDEREVAPDHPDRNEAMIRRELLAGHAAEARLVSLIPPGDLPDRYDLAVLGMGADGHTASLFPGSPDLDRALKSSRKLERLEVPQLGAHRVSLTPAALLASERICLLFFGKDKRVVFDSALHGTDVAEIPVRAMLNQRRVPVTVYWAP